MLFVLSIISLHIAAPTYKMICLFVKFRETVQALYVIKILESLKAKLQVALEPMTMQMY